MASWDGGEQRQTNRIGNRAAIDGCDRINRGEKAEYDDDSKCTDCDTSWVISGMT